MKPELLKFLNEKLNPLVFELEKEIAEKLDLASKKETELDEEEYFRIVGKVYKLSNIDANLKDLIYAYKSPEVSDEIKKKLRTLLINCNTALVLSILGGILSDRESEMTSTPGELLAEGYKALIEALDKYEVDFTHEKSTKNTKIVLKEIKTEGLLVRIDSNKPFGTLDITIKRSGLDEPQEETINQAVVWNEEGNLYWSDVLLDFTILEGNYEELADKQIKLSVSKKVGHPSTFFTNSIYFAIKNYIVKNQLLTINSNSYILKNQIKKITTLYEDQFGMEPTKRWISIYLLTQNSQIVTFSKTDYTKYLAWVGTKKEHATFDEVDLVLRELENGEALILLKNKEVKRLLMMKNKNATQKNKKNFNSLDLNISGIEDQYIYTSEFEKRIIRKVREIDKIKHYIAGVDSLDRSIGDEEEGSTLGDMIVDSSENERIHDELNMESYKAQFLELGKKVLSPKEYFYFIAYYYFKIELKDLGNIGLYQDSSITDIKQILRRSFTKISFWSQFRNFFQS